MKDKEIMKLSKKCTTIRDKIIKQKLKTEDEILTHIKKKMSQEEIEELAKQFLLKEAINLMLSEMTEEYKDNQDNEMMYV